MGAFTDIVREPLAGRLSKPRRQGLTVVMDKGLGPAATRDLLAVAGPYIDMWKFAFGSGALYPERLLREKLNVLRAEQIDSFPGGTFVEAAVLQNMASEVLQRARDLGFTAIEMSVGHGPKHAPPVA